ncbi:MATE family efflux transporter [Metabacillus herbersteinensis]|uniref:MATE family efflux transporter n=1 Tax=Metabacillus herbersteinensis TaxID=283816 RepID=A0ABV6GKR6_9BACI
MNHRNYLMLALPLIFSTITTPLIGAVDTAVVGQLPGPEYIGGVAVGAILFSTMYWLFGFLRVGTSGFTAQAHGARDEKAIILSLVRPLYIAAVCGCLFILLKLPISTFFIDFINPTDQVKEHGLTYIDIRIWGAPFALINYVILGWLMGLSKIKEAFYLQVGMNVMNIVLDLLFVFVFSWGVSGVAAATLLAEISSVVIGILVVIRVHSMSTHFPSIKMIFDGPALVKQFNVNRDLFIRTACLLIMFNLFTKMGAVYGTEVLAANAILIQIHFLMAYFFDGFANASSILTGRAIGSGERGSYTITVSLTHQWSIYSAVFITVVYFCLKDTIIGMFTQLKPVADLASHYGSWLLLYPITACFGLVFYGIFTGATSASPIRNSMIYSLLLFSIILWATLPTYGNHGLWFAFIMFSSGRSLFLLMYLPKLNRNLYESFADSGKILNG